MLAPPKYSAGYTTAMNIKLLHYLFLAGLILTACQTQIDVPAATAIATATQPVAPPTVSAMPTEAATPLPSETPTTEPTAPPSLLPTIFLQGSPVPLTTDLPVINSTANPPPTGLPGPGPSSQAFVSRAIKELAARLGVAEKDIKIVRVEDVDWPDPSLGLPEPDRLYAQVITPGQRILLSYANKTYEYRSGNGMLKFAGEVQP
jgi:hypothetical protein